MASALLATGCGKSDEDESGRLEKKAREDAEAARARAEAEEAARARAGELRARGEDLKDRASSSVEDTLSGIEDRLSAIEDRASALRDQAAALSDRGEELGRSALELIRPYATGGMDHIENLIVDGKTNAVQAAKLAAVVAPAIADGVGFRPIYIDLTGEDAKESLDRAIGKMPRVEVVDGLTVGFRPFTKRQFLVAWRQGDRLVGFVYTSLVDVAIGHVVEQAPRLISLASAIL